MNGLIEIARTKMRYSRDPIHDHLHVERVVAYAREFSDRLKLDVNQKEALVLAAWWHDVSRTLTRKPSFILMPFIDDILSAFMLAWRAFSIGRWNGHTSLAARTILCKSLGTGALFTKIFMLPANRIMVDTLRDADTLDVLRIERMKHLIALSDTSRIYHVGYRLTIWWFVGSTQLYMKTEVAREFAILQLKNFLEWLKQPALIAWHIAEFGYDWVEKTLARSEKLFQELLAMTENPLATSL